MAALCVRLLGWQPHLFLFLSSSVSVFRLGFVVVDVAAGGNILALVIVFIIVVGRFFFFSVLGLRFSRGARAAHTDAGGFLGWRLNRPEGTAASSNHVPVLSSTEAPAVAFPAFAVEVGNREVVQQTGGHDADSLANSFLKVCFPS